jgi:hypothetical protein
LALQDHGNPVRYRNIWLRKLPGPEEEPSQPEGRLSAEILKRYAGTYATEEGSEYRLFLEGEELRARFIRDQSLELILESPRRFSLKRTAGELEFELDAQGNPIGVTFHIGGTSRKAKKIQ